jgi:Zn-dependent protease
MGIIMAMTAGFGWAKPVPVNPRAFYPSARQGMLLVALAGPFSNLVIAFVLGGFYQGLDVILPNQGVFGAFLDIILVVIIFNLAMTFFNLIPLYPLDGWRILIGLLPPEQAWGLARREREATFALIMLLLIGIMSPELNLIGLVMNPPIRLFLRLFTGT